MDIFSHGLWAAAGATVAKKRKLDIRVGWATFFGVAPDLFSFGIHTAAMFLGFAAMPMQYGSEPEEYIGLIPQYVDVLYNWTHSLVVFLAVFLILWAIRRKPLWELGGWGLHILIDIPTHTSKFFPTPFLWPVSEARVSGISWGTPWFMGLNIILLAFTWLWLWRKRSSR